MASASRLRLLGLLPDQVHRYAAGVAAGDLQAEECSRIEICSSIEYLLAAHLDGCRGWDAAAMVDGVLPASLTVSDSGVVTLTGLAVWTGHGKWFTDPVAARVELSADRQSVKAYSLRFGDAEAGLGKFPCQPRAKDLYRPPPQVWCFAFGQAR